MVSRRQFIELAGSAWLASHFVKLPTELRSRSMKPLRCINIVNFMRGDEPRLPMDLLRPVEKQMESIKRHGLPATWLMQYDALVTGKWTPFLKANMPQDHEVGFWFEMNQLLCDAADVAWRGRKGYEWDSQPSVAFTIGYSPEERIKLADAAMKGFKSVWGAYPKSVASWNLDSLTIAHLVDQYGVEGFAVCRDQLATDGFTIWGAPIAGYYPSKTNAWSPALKREHQIGAPIFRMLGQDPVHYYEVQYTLPNGQLMSEPDTMEPVWPSGQDPHFVDLFLKVITNSPCGEFAYAQLGQENNFGWPAMQKGFELQMEVLARLKSQGAVHLETMGDSAGRFKHQFQETPIQMQIQMEDPFPTKAGSETTAWYQSRFYRANLNFRNGLPYLRDIMVYADGFSQPHLKVATRSDSVDQRALAVLDGAHWKGGADAQLTPTAGGFFVGEDGEALKLAKKPKVEATEEALAIRLDLTGGHAFQVHFDETAVTISADSADTKPFGLDFKWNPAASALKSVQPHRAEFEYEGFRYAVKIEAGEALQTDAGWRIRSANGRIKLKLAQN